MTAGSSKTTEQRKKEEDKLKMEQLDAKRKEEAEDKAKAECATAKQMGGQVEEEERGFGRS